MHKEECEKKEDNPFYIDTKPASEAARVFIEEDREKEIPSEILAKLDESEELKNLLQNPHLVITFTLCLANSKLLCRLVLWKKYICKSPN